MSKITYNPSLNPQQAFVDVDAASIDLLDPVLRLEEIHKKLGEAYEHLSGWFDNLPFHPHELGLASKYERNLPLVQAHGALARAWKEAQFIGDALASVERAMETVGMPLEGRDP